MIPPQIKKLDGRTVLVRTLSDDHNPQIARRGSIRVREESDPSGYRVELVLDYPDMFNQPAHQRIVLLNQQHVGELIASSVNGAYQFTIEDPLDVPAEAPHRVPPGTLVTH